MNQLVERLWTEAAVITARLPSGRNNSWETEVKFIDTFAKLIATECAYISDACFHDGSTGYLAIKKHFGIEDEPTI